MSGMNVTANDIVKIIKACKSSNVKYLKFDTLEMGFSSDEFDTKNHLNKTKNSANHMDVISASDEGQLPPGPNSLTEQRIDDYGIGPDELADQLAIEDPVAYEELQLKLFNKGETR